MNYFTPGQIYTFRSINQNYTNTRVISIVFDETGNASIGITSESIQPTDTRCLYIFADNNLFEINNNVINITGDIEKFWFVYFDEVPEPIENAATTSGGGTITVTCPCLQGNGNCTEKALGEGNCRQIVCNPTSECTICGKPIVEKGGIVNTDIFVLLQANNIQLQ